MSLHYQSKAHYKLDQLEDTLALGALLAQLIKAGDIILLEGDLGAGKTHFTKGLAAGLNSKQSVTSPTFSLMQIYDGQNSDGQSLKLFHFDLYRIEKSSELVDIDFRGLLEQDAASIIEWGERFTDELPDQYLLFRISKQPFEKLQQAEVQQAVASSKLQEAGEQQKVEEQQKAEEQQEINSQRGEGDYPSQERWVRLELCSKERAQKQLLNSRAHELFESFDQLLLSVSCDEQGDALFAGQKPKALERAELSKLKLSADEKQASYGQSACGQDTCEQNACEQDTCGQDTCRQVLHEQVYQDKASLRHLAQNCDKPEASYQALLKSNDEYCLVKGFMLACDSAGEVLGLGLAHVSYRLYRDQSIQIRELKPLYSTAIAAPRRANEVLIEASLEMLDKFDLDVKQLSAVLVGRGPGSFTGVRIAVATAKGLAQSLKLPLLGVSSLEAMAQAYLAQQSLKDDEMLLVLADAMRKEVYPALFSLDQNLDLRRHSLDYQVIKAQEFAELLEKKLLIDADKKLHMCGDALKKYPLLAKEATYSSKDIYPHGLGLFLAAQKSYLDKRLLPEDYHPAALLPVYTRLSDAEEAERIKLGLPPKKASQLIEGVASEFADKHLQIQSLSINDLPELSELESQLFIANAWSYDAFLSELQSPLSRSWYIARDQGELIAYAGASFVGEVADLLNVAVAPSHRRQGIASKLIERIAYDMQIRACTRMLLEVADNNESAQQCYKKLGFTEINRRKGYYQDGQDALIMQADLPLKKQSTEPLSDALSLETPSSDASNLAASSPGLPKEDKLSPGAQALSSLKLFRNAKLDEQEKRELKNLELILAIESSCDETAAALIDKTGKIVSSCIASQIDYHARFGGVVPEIASRKHTEAIVGLIDQVFDEASNKLGLSSALSAEDLAAIAVTQGPGLVGALVVGLAFAKGFACGHKLPLIGVNHLEGHLYANLLINPELKPPFIASLLSGGHTMLVEVKDWGDYKILGQTLDDAVGEAFDKVSKALGLGYPGGPIISRLAQKGNPKAIDFPRALLHSHDYRFSLSGLKTAVVNYIHKENSAGRAVNAPDLAASFQAAVVEVQIAKIKAALEETGITEYCLGGGVAANPELRSSLQRELEGQGVRVNLPPLSACTDNAEMIALVALEKYKAQDFLAWSADSLPNMPLDSSFGERHN